MDTLNKVRAKMSRRALLIGIGLLLVGLFALLYNTVVASPPPLLDQGTLEAKAVTVAQNGGLRGAPLAKRAVQMTLADWLARNDAELGKDAADFGLTPDMPVFVLAMRGNVEWQGPGQPRPGQSGPDHYDNITVVLDARTGETVWVGSTYTGLPMPVPVP